MERETRIMVAVVDDDDAVRDSLRALLEQQHFVVIDFSSAIDFLAWEDRASVGCLLLDLHMPKMSGIELLHHLQQSSETCPTILLSDRLRGGIAEQAQQLGVVAVLPKPVPPSLLLSAIQQAQS